MVGLFSFNINAGTGYVQQDPTSYISGALGFWYRRGRTLFTGYGETTHPFPVTFRYRYQELSNTFEDISALGIEEKSETTKTCGDKESG